MKYGEQCPLNVMSGFSNIRPRNGDGGHIGFARLLIIRMLCLRTGMILP